MAGYTRQRTYSDGDVIQAADSNTEFDQLLASFSSTAGHKHDGTAAEGPVIGLIGDVGSVIPFNKLSVSTVDSRFSFYVDVASVAVEQLRVEDGVVYPVTNNDIDLGTSVLMFKDGYFSGVLTADLSTISSTGDLAVADGGTGSSTAAGARTTLDVDQAGTALALSIALG